MRVRFASVIFTAIVIGIGLITLIGLLVGDGLGLLSEIVAAFQIRLLANIFVRVAAVTLSVALLLGILNLLYVHLLRIFRGRGASGRLGSLVVLVSFGLGVAPLGTDMRNLLLEDVQVAIESALAALLFFALVYGAMRIMRHEVSFSRLLFVFAVLLVLVGALPLGIDVLDDLTTWFMAIPVSAGARGILLGIALATVVTGIRVLIGQDRSYGE